MRRILLVIDDFNELVGLETLSRRLGFDVLSIGKDLLVKDALLRFHPEIVVATFKGRAVDGYALAKKMKKTTPALRFAVIHASTMGSLPADAGKLIDAVIDSPLRVEKTINTLAQMAGLDPKPLLKKYEKITGAKLKADDELVLIQPDGSAGVSRQVTVRDGAKNTDGEQSARTERYNEFLKANRDVKPAQDVLPTERMRQAHRELARDSAGEKEALERLDEEKREFVKALFKK